VPPISYDNAVPRPGAELIVPITAISLGIVVHIRARKERHSKNAAASHSALLMYSVTAEIL
jgi:hypothetical protein